jgi:lipopolysaccharide export system permease protein
MQTLWKYLEDLVGKGLGFQVIFEFIFYFAIHLIPLALPLAILLSSIMTFGNLGERYELVAMKSAGVSLLKAMRPMFVISVILGIAAFYTANNFIPKANLNWGALLYDVMNKKPGVNIEDNVFYKDIEGYAIRVGKKHKDNETIENILIYVSDPRKKGNNNILMAEKGKMYITSDEKYMVLQLENGKRYQELVNDKEYPKRMQHNTMAFKSYKMAIDIGELKFNRTKKELFKEDHRMLNISELEVRIDSLSDVIQKRHCNLYRYLEPYFPIPPDTVETGSVSIDERTKTLKNMALVKLNEPAHLTEVEALPEHTRKMIEKQQNKRTLDSNLTLDRAIQQAHNVKRISSNSINDSKSNVELKAKYLIEWHRKYTLAVSCILLFFIGAPLGAIIRKGGFGLPLVISILLFVLYYVINVIGEKLVKESQMDSFSGMWLSTFILFPIAIFLTYKASTDSKLFDADFYNKLARFFKRK